MLNEDERDWIHPLKKHCPATPIGSRESAEWRKSNACTAFHLTMNFFQPKLRFVMTRRNSDCFIVSLALRSLLPRQCFQWFQCNGMRIGNCDSIYFTLFKQQPVTRWQQRTHIKEMKRKKREWSKQKQWSKRVLHLIRSFFFALCFHRLCFLLSASHFTFVCLRSYVKCIWYTFSRRQCQPTAHDPHIYTCMHGIMRKTPVQMEPKLWHRHEM